VQRVSIKRQLRIVHGLAVTLGTISSGRDLIGILRNLDFILSRHPDYIVWYVGLFLTNLVIAFSAWYRFGKRFLRLSIFSYLVWLPLFAWYEWWSDSSPLRAEVDYPLSPSEVFERLWPVFYATVFYVCGYALFPVLCYLDKHQRDPGGSRAALP
jgi:uncharacterized membrane-anchored protein YitT (DUF2179 family)